MKYRFGFIQGRLSARVCEKIQAFPKETWRDEFKEAKELNLECMEWTIDDEDFYENPIVLPRYCDEVNSLCHDYGVSVDSITCDFFMQNPFFKDDLSSAQKHLKKIRDLSNNSSKINTKYLVIPLVDNSSISKNETDRLVDFFMQLNSTLKKNKQMILFESDLPPRDLLEFINRFDANYFGVNFDSGNSAFKGYDFKEEFSLYGERIKNIHLKDRSFNGPTLKFGQGDCDFKLVKDLIKEAGYSGNLIFQGARAEDEMHKEVIKEYRDYFLKV